MADSSLDDFIKQKRSSSRASRGGGRGFRRGGRGPRAGRGGRQRTYSSNSSSTRFSSTLNRRGAGTGFKATRARRGSSFGGRGTPQSNNNIQLGGPMGTSLIVSNLEFGVNDADIHELFSEFGRLRRYGVHYNAQGSSIGTAEVVFTRASDAMKAIQAYQDVPLDGRPMRLHVAMSSFRITQIPGGATSPAPSRGGAGGGGGGARRGGKRGRGGRSSRGGGRTMPSAIELNDELDLYHRKSDKSENMEQN